MVVVGEEIEREKTAVAPVRLDPSIVSHQHLGHHHQRDRELSTVGKV